MKIQIPELSLVVLIGASSSGKSTFAARHFKPTEVISSDFCRALVSNDENDLSATADAFEVLHFIVRKRLAAGRLTVVDATNLQPEARRPLITLARDQHCLPIALVFDLPVRLLKDRNRVRTDRRIPPPAIDRQADHLRRSHRSLAKEGFHAIYAWTAPEQVDAVTVERQRIWSDRRDDRGPFDIVGDVHGCYDELVALLGKLGYAVSGTSVVPPAGRRAIFIGDLVDRGPDTPGVLRLVMSMVHDGTALCLPGNHDVKLVRAMRGRRVQVTHGLEASLSQLAAETPEFKDEVARFLDGLVSHYVLDAGRLVVAHAGMTSEMQGRASKQVREFALFGETTGETDEFGLPVRFNWAEAYRGSALVVYGHTPVAEARWENNTINIDTGCVFGGRLTALRYPERELVSVPAAREHYHPARPLTTPAPQVSTAGTLLDIADVTGRRSIETRLLGRVTLREEQARAAVEVMSRFAVDPRWLIYLPPTMAPTETSSKPDLLEHPSEAFAYYASKGVSHLVCEEKHMGSRAVVVVCVDQTTAQRRFGSADGRTGICFTRTGRPFFTDAVMEAGVLDRVRMAADAAGLWQELDTDWLCLDCELMPWSAKAEELLKDQYAAVGTAARVALTDAAAALKVATGRGLPLEALKSHTRSRLQAVARYGEAYRRFVWPVHSVDDLRLAPFHLLASAGTVHVDRDHEWHMRMAERLATADATRGGGRGVVVPTTYRKVDVGSATDVAEAFRWWEDLTLGGAEGVVVKPLAFVARGPRGPLQPGLKSRGREYLRIIYGPEYTLSDNLERLRARGLARKRSLAMREFALGIEALERFVRGDPLYRVHECVLGVLALESEPVDPRL
ncbi:MAG TPA: polynucleotide kinase-phosphatase [bacterium]